MLNWDYQLPKNWQPKNDAQWIWYLERSINYGLFNKKLNLFMVKKYLPKLKIDPLRKKYIEFIIKKDAHDIK